MTIPARLLPHTVTHIRPAETTDAYGNTTYDYGEAATRTDIKAWIQQDHRKLSIEDGRVPRSQRWLMVTNHADITDPDRIEWNSITFRLEGPPAPVFTPQGALTGAHHTEVTLVAVTG